MTSSNTINTHVHQGEFVISDNPDEMLTTILGSCIAVCLWEPRSRVGGMNHFLLPDTSDENNTTVKYGAHAMEILINSILKRGARRSLMEAKVFGGARMSSSFQDIGKANAEFALSFLKTEGIPCISKSVGGSRARKVRFWPTIGRAQQSLIAGLQVEEASPTLRKAPMPNNPDSYLF